MKASDGLGALELSFRFMKSYPRITVERIGWNKPETDLGKVFRKSGLEIRESQCLDTDLNLMRDFRGSLTRICMRRSSLLATISHDFEG